MSTRLSYSQVNTYNTCGQKYKLSYLERYKEKYFHAALAFGSAIDASLNELLTNRDLDKAKAVFDKTWAFQHINGVYTELPYSELLVYAEKDFDEELLTDADLDKLDLYINTNTIEAIKQPMVEYSKLKELKAVHGFDGFTTWDRSFYNYANWLCLAHKGHIMLESYNKDILPRIKNVLAVQHKFELKNEENDIILGYVDLVAEMQDGTVILFDNKTSSRDYEADQAARSAQLIIYYHELKSAYKIDRVGFIVMNKNIKKNRTKVCEVCSFDGSGARHKSCPNEASGKRCNGTWKETISPECYTQVIINEVTPIAEDLVLSAFDAANDGIKKQVYTKNLNACKQGSFLCPYIRHCWNGDDSDLVKQEEK